MDPSTQDYVQLIREIRDLMALQHAAILRHWQDESGLQPSAGKLLAELSHRGESRVSDLALQRMVDASVISRQVAQLERLGMVRRRKAETDGRVVLLSITPEGERALERWRQTQVSLFQSALRDWDAAALHDATSRIGEINAGLRAGLEGDAAATG